MESTNERQTGNQGENRSKGSKMDLYVDADYIALTENYQQANFERCKELLALLSERYPGHERLAEFQRDIDLQLSLRSLDETHTKEEKRSQTRKTVRLSLFTVFSIIVVLLIFGGFYAVLSSLAEQKVTEKATSQAVLLEQQVNDLLKSGQPGVAADLVARIREMDPAYAGLADLSARTDALLQLKDKYDQAKILMESGNDSQALALLTEIESASPGLWDVEKRISDSEKGIQVTKLIEEGNTFYQAENWQSAITSYEAALELNPDLNDANMKDQLLSSYLRQIIQLLESDDSTVEQIQQAEGYYRKATGMIPQSRAFASERGNLQQVSSNLLELKYTKTANNLLLEKNQTFASISSAVAYLNKAVNLDPQNKEVQQTLKNAQLYQVGFQNILELNWSQAINNLTQVMEADPNYANGNARQLLYEAYYALGKKYTEVGLYTDARSNLEQAEILAFDAGENKLQLFQVQLALGDSIARMGNFQDAASYFQYAFSRINALSRVAASSDLYKYISTGDSEAAAGNFEAAVESYQQAMKDVAQFYTIKTIEAPDGATLPFFAAENNSTTEAILKANRLPQAMTITFGRELDVPTIE